MRLPFYVLNYLDLRLFAATAAAAETAETARSANGGALAAFTVAYDKEKNQRNKNFAV